MKVKFHIFSLFQHLLNFNQKKEKQKKNCNQLGFFAHLILKTRSN